MQAKLQQQGIRSFVMHFRGCSDEPNLKPRIYHSGETEDAKEIFALMRTRYPRTPIFAAGFSLGGNVLLKWLGESETPPDLVAAVAVSVPYQLEVASDTMDNGFSKFYRNIMLKELKRLMLQKKKLFQRANEDHHSTYNELGNMKRHKTFRDFDHHVVAPLHGFESADDYYQRSSSRQYLKNIAVPTLLIHGKDDPLMTPEVVPNAEELSATTTLEAFEHGGHVGFVSGSLIKPRYWLEKRIPDFIQYHLKENNQRAAIKVSETA
ncbi:MAG: alpha/beta fold hydrolase [Pseudomonadales bacterium]|nr:alpha/beta fold hydrolase [Pseudomonadales bacterium]